MPVILPADDDRPGEEHNKQHHEMHGMDNKDDEMHTHHDHDSMNHNEMNHEMNHSSHSSMHMMNQGTIMYMDGFHSALFPSSHQLPPPCLNLFHPSWTLHTPTKFVFAMVCVTLIGMVVEACGVWRVKCLRKGRRCRREATLKRRRQWEEQQLLRTRNMQGEELELSQHGSQSRGIQHGVSDISDVSSEAMANSAPPATATATSATPICPAIFRRMWRSVPKSIRTLCETICARICYCFLPTSTTGTKQARRYDLAAASLHAARAVFGYLLMLAVMSYAIEFLICAVLGMVLGRYWFVDMVGGGDNVIGGGGGVLNGAVGVGGGIGGMGLVGGGGGSPGVGMTDLKNGGNNHDGMWGGGDPCCGIDDDDEDENNNHDDEVVSLNDGSLQNDMREPLLSSLMGNNVGVTRRSGGGGLQTDENP